MAPLTTAALALCIFAACAAHSLPAQNENEEFLKTAETVNVGYSAANSLAYSQNQQSNFKPNSLETANAPFWWMGENSPFRRASASNGNGNAPTFVTKQKPQLDLSNNPFLNGKSKYEGGAKPVQVVSSQNTGFNQQCEVCVSKHLCQNGFVRANVQGLTNPRNQAPFCDAPSQVCCAVERESSAIVNGPAEGTYIPDALSQCGPPNTMCVPFHVCNSKGLVDPSAGIPNRKEFRYCLGHEVCCMIPENYDVPLNSAFTTQYPAIDIRFGAEDQYTAAGTQNVESHAKFEQGSSKNKFGAKPPRQAPSYTSQDDADGYQYTKPTQGYLPAASSVDEATKKPFKADAYIPPVDDERHFSGSKISAGSILPPKRPVPEEDKQAGGTNNSPTVIRPQQQNEVAPVPLPQHGCAAALKCVNIDFCTFEGVISKSTVTLTPRQNEYRVPLTDCLLPESTKESPQIGKCCRDPDYVDPWPASQLGQYNPDLGGFDNGQYKGERYQSKHRQQPQVNNNQQQGQSLSGSSSQVQQSQRTEQPHRPLQPQQPQRPLQPQQPQRPLQPQQPQQPHQPQQPQQPQQPHQHPLSPQPSSQRPQSTAYQHQQQQHQQNTQFQHTTQFQQNTYQSSPRPQQPQFQQPSFKPQGQIHQTGSGSLSSNYHQTNVQQTQFQQNNFQSSPRPQVPQFHQNTFPTTSVPQFQQNTFQTTLKPHVPQFQQNTYHSTQQTHFQQSTQVPQFQQNTFQTTPRPHFNQPSQRPQTPQFQQNTFQTTPRPQFHQSSKTPQTPSFHQDTYQSSPRPQFPTTARPQYTQFQQSTTGQYQSTYKQEFQTTQRQDFNQFQTSQRQDFNQYQSTQKTNFQQNVFESKFPTTPRPQLPHFQPDVSYTGNSGQNEPPKSSYDVPEYSATGSRNCGFRNTNASPIGPGPIDGSFGEFPWQAMVLLQTNKSLLCGGAIVEQDAVVTAAHCVNGLNPNDVLIKGGEWKLGVDDEPKTFQIVKVKSISFHPAYQPTDLLYDVAILHLEEKLRFDTHIGSICVPETDQEPEQIVQESKKCVATGWGKETLQVHLKDSIIHKLDIDLLPSNQCENRKSYYFGASFDRESGFCARPTDREENICEVDYGSALACEKDDGKYYLQAVYSWDSGCQASEQVTSFSKIDAAWLRKTLKNPQQKKPYPTPKPQKPQFQPTQPAFEQTQKPYQPTQQTFQPQKQYQPTQATFQETQRPYQPTFQDTQKPYQPTQTTFQETHKPYQPTHGTFQDTQKPYKPTQATYQETPKPYQPTQATYQETPKPYQPTQATYQETPRPYQPTQDRFLETQRPYQPTQRTQKPYQPTRATFQQSPTPFESSRVTSRPQSPFEVSSKPQLNFELPKFEAPQPQATSDNFLRPQEHENPFKGSATQGPMYLPPLP